MSQRHWYLEVSECILTRLLMIWCWKKFHVKDKNLFKKPLRELLINILKTENSYPSTASIISKISYSYLRVVINTFVYFLLIKKFCCCISLFLFVHLEIDGSISNRLLTYSARSSKNLYSQIKWYMFKAFNC